MSARLRKTLIGLAAVAVAAAGLALGLRFLSSGSPAPALQASGTVEATEGHLGFQTSGRIAEILVQEGDPVIKDDTLALLNRRESLARRDAAEAEAAAADARLRELETGYRFEEVEQARAELAGAAEKVTDAERDLDRTRRLWEGGATSRESYDKAITAHELAKSTHRRTEQQLRLLEAGPREETISAQRALVDAARAAVRVMDAVLENMIVVAPFDGVVTVRHREPGEVLAPGAAVLTLMNTTDRWVRIYVREDRIGAVKLGQAALISSDTYPDKRYEGRVRFIASEAEFTPKNVQTAEERVKLVYAVKIQITGDRELELKPGMPADVEIDLEPLDTAWQPDTGKGTAS
ncbi:MAG: HlyD family efflux transporter periplasmic adaptor subunit [Gemmatimonadota bacterium]|jgi:HlyD family secretion protein